MRSELTRRNALLLGISSATLAATGTAECSATHIGQ